MVSGCSPGIPGVENLDVAAALDVTALVSIVLLMRKGLKHARVGVHVQGTRCADDSFVLKLLTTQD